MSWITLLLAKCTVFLFRGSRKNLAKVNDWLSWSKQLSLYPISLPMKNGAALIKWLKFQRSGKKKTFREFAISAKRLSTSINETEKGCAISSTHTAKHTAKHFCPTDFLSRLFQLLQVTAVMPKPLASSASSAFSLHTMIPCGRGMDSRSKT